MKKTLLLWLFGLLLTTQVFAQNRSLSGTVKDAASGEALIGVNVTGKGTTIGTVTDIDGKYTLELPKDVTTLVFTYVGYKNLEKPILTLKIDAALSADGQILEELVVTGMQVKREARSTSFANNTVKSDDFNKTATNPFSALQSKSPGVRISNSSGAVGSSTRIVLQGEASFSNGNNPLIVVDGNPINNNTSSNLENSSGSYVDFGNRGNDINPDDIESITVLKGASAVAIYGSRGTSGVILITTKSGKGFAKQDKKFSVSINTGLTFDKAYLQIKRQNKYGQGYDFAPDPIENFSWGPAFDGVVRPWTPAIQTPNGTSQLIRPYSAVKDQIEAAFNVGITSRSGIAIEGGDEKYSYYFAYGNLTNKGIFQNTFYKRHNFTGNASVKFSDNLSSRFSVQYSKIYQRAFEGAGVGNFGGPFQAILQQAVNIPINELRDYNSPYQDFGGYYGGYTANPFYLMDNINNDNKVDNLIASAEIEYKPVSYLTMTARIGDNMTMGNTYLQSPKYQYAKSGAAPGSYAEVYEKRNQLNFDGFVTFNKEIVKKLNMSVMAGFNFTQNKGGSLIGQTQGGLVIPGFYDLSNSASTVLTSSDAFQRRLMGLYGQLTLGYRNMIFAEYTARNDWSSTLPEGNRGFFFQGGGLSFVPTELFKTQNEWLSYAKIRANAGTQGKDPGLYLLNSTYSANPLYDDYSESNLPIRFPVQSSGGASISGFTADNTIGNPGLKPELTFEWSLGADLDLLKDYLHVEYTYYDKTSKDLVVNVQLPASSGFTRTAKNVGKISNKGHELLVRATALKNVKGINWDFRLQFAKNVSKVLKVSDENDEISLNTGGIQVVVKEGLPFGTYKAFDYEKTPEGNTVVNASGVPVVSTSYSYYGSFQPKYTMGVGSTLSWKGLTFDIQFDIKQGGLFYSGTKDAMDFNGTSLSSLVNDRQPYVYPGSVQLQDDGTYAENTTPITNLYALVGSVPESQHLIDASYIKLREASISYTLDKKYLGKSKISGITFSVVGRNLKFWLPSQNVFADPESNSFGQAGDVQGLEFSSVPSARSIGFDVRVKF